MQQASLSLATVMSHLPFVPAAQMPVAPAVASNPASQSPWFTALAQPSPNLLSQLAVASASNQVLPQVVESYWPGVPLVHHGWFIRM